MRKVTMLCGLVLVLGASGVAAQRPGHRHRDSTAVNLNSGVSTGRRLHNPGNTSVQDLGVVQGPGMGGQGKVMRRGNVGKWERAGNMTATVSPPVSAPAQGGSIQPAYTRYKKGSGSRTAPGLVPSRHGPPGGAAPGRASALNDVTVGGNKNPAGMVSPRVKANPVILDSGPTARRMPRPRHRQRPDSLNLQ